MIRFSREEMLRLLDSGHTPARYKVPNLYRAMSPEALLYVGISSDLRRRLLRHRCGSVWWDQADLFEVELFPDRHAALRAERRAINTEAPLYNRLRLNAPRNPNQGDRHPDLRGAIAVELGEDPVVYCQRRRAAVPLLSYDAVAAEIRRQCGGNMPSHLGGLLKVWVLGVEDDWLPTGMLPSADGPPDSP